MVQYVLQEAGRPMHIQEILNSIERHFHRRLNRDSLVSSLLKKVQREETFEKAGPNRFALKGGR
jgi:hypothetical protein